MLVIVQDVENRNANRAIAAYVIRMFDMRRREDSIEHCLTKTNHSWINGQVERMSRTIKETTVRQCHFDSHDQLQRHLDDFVDAFDFRRRLKTLQGLTPYEFICKT